MLKHFCFVKKKSLTETVFLNVAKVSKLCCWMMDGCVLSLLQGEVTTIKNKNFTAHSVQVLFLYFY